MIGTNHGIFVSFDFGESWIEKSSGLLDQEIQCLFFEKINQVYYAGTKQAGIFRFMEIANKWTSYNTNLPAKNIQVITSSSQYLYTGTKSEGIFRVKLGSEKWTDLNFDDKNPIIKECDYRVILPFHDQLIWCATDKGLLVTENGGENWRLREDNSMLGSSILSIAIDPQKTTRLIIGTESKGLIESLDQGKTWKEIAGNFGKGEKSQFLSILFNPLQPGSIFVSSKEKIYETIDDGKSFRLINQGIEEARITLISLLSDSSSNYVCAGTESSGFFILRNARPPFKPTSLTARIEGSSVLLNWRTSLDGSGKVAGYHVYKKKEGTIEGFVKISTVTEISYLDKDVVWNEKLHYYVTAFDNTSSSLESNPSQPVSILVDDLPSIEVIEPKDGAITELSQISIKGRITDLGSGIAEGYLIVTGKVEKTEEYPLTIKNDGSFVQLVTLSMGFNHIKILAIDNNSLSSELIMTINRKDKDPDLKAPEILINQPINDFVSEEDLLTVSGIIKDNETGIFEAKIWNTIDGNRIGTKILFLSKEGFFLEKLPVQIGKNVVTIQALDGAGNLAEKTIVGLVRKPDIVPPSLIILDPSDGFTTVDNTIKIVGRSTDDNSGVESTVITLLYLGKVMYEKKLTLDEKGLFAETLTLMEGENVFTIISTDKRSNQTKVTLKGIRIPKPVEIEIVLQIGLKNATINDEVKELQAAPVIKNGKTFVPVRFLAEAFGANVNWVPSRKEIQITYQDIYITLWLHQSIISVESLSDIMKVPETKFLEYPPFLSNGVTMVPLRFIIEEWKADVLWEKETQKIVIRLKK